MSAASAVSIDVNVTVTHQYQKSVRWCIPYSSEALLTARCSRLTLLATTGRSTPGSKMPRSSMVVWSGSNVEV